MIRPRSWTTQPETSFEEIKAATKPPSRMLGKNLSHQDAFLTSNDLIRGGFLQVLEETHALGRMSRIEAFDQIV